MSMYSKAVPKPLQLSQLSPRKLRKPHGSRSNATGATGEDRDSKASVPDADVFGNIGSRSASTWEILDSPPPSGGISALQESSPVPSPAKSSTKIKRWLLRRKNVDGSQEAMVPGSSLSTPPSTAPAHMEHSRSAPNLKIDPPQLTLEELAKIDAFYAPTPILPETPAPRLGKVYPSWSPDIDYRFKPTRSASLHVGNIRTAGIERGISRAESLKRFQTGRSVSNPVPTQPPEPSSSCSEVTFDSQRRGSARMRPASARRSVGGDNWRHQWVYSKPEDETEVDSDEDEDEDEQRTVAADTDHNGELTGVDDSKCKTPVEPFTLGDGGLFFTVGESPVGATGEVTLRFIKDPFDHPSSSPEEAFSPSGPSSSTDSL